MMTLKLIKEGRTRILEAESFTVLRQVSDSEPRRYWAEITGHRAHGEGDFRFDVGESDHPEEHRIYDVAYIENELGKTVEVVAYQQTRKAA